MSWNIARADDLEICLKLNFYNKVNPYKLEKTFKI